MPREEVEETISHLERKKIDERRIRKKRSEDLSAVEAVFDRSTLLTLYHLINSGVISELFGVISTGKEANVYWAKGGDEDDYAVKIFRTVTADFKKMSVYVQGDPRFKRIKKDTRSLIYTWATKEFKNLTRAQEAKVRVPKPIAVRNNVLVMEFIGDDGIPAPRLKDMAPEDPNDALNVILKYIRNLYQTAKLIHADLSEYNILVWNEPVIIDISQGVLIQHPLAQEFLLRDIKNILRYFRPLVNDIPSTETVYRKIVGGKAK
ncbi:MAG: serine protein kinase RIO [Candidatus Hodarchaeota archaeon]